MNKEQIIRELKKRDYTFSKLDINCIFKGDFKREENNLIVGWQYKLMPTIFYDFFK